MLNHGRDGAAGVLDKFDAGSFHGEAIFGMRDERDLAGSARIDHKTASLQGDWRAFGHAACFINANILCENLGRNTKLLAALSDQVRLIALVFADVFDQLSIRDQIELDGKRPRASVRFGIFESDLEIDMAGVAAMEALGDTQCL